MEAPTMAKKRKTGATARKKAGRTTAKKAMKRTSYSIPSTKKPRTKGEFFRVISENTELSRSQVAQVFDVMGKMIEADLKKGGPGVVNVAGLMKVMVKRVPAKPARRGVNPFTGEEQMFKPKPARNVIKVRPLKSLKDRV
jgi:nucleoid DNA-binding protein